MDVNFYMNFMDTITNSVISANFLINMIDLKYRKSISSILFTVITLMGGLVNLKIIDIFNMSIPQGVIFKPIANSVFNIFLIYSFSKYRLKKSILVQIYYLIMGYSVEFVGIFFVGNYQANSTIFIENTHRMLYAIMGNVTFCSVSMVYLLIYFKYKNKLENNYIFLLLILPMLQIFIFEKYTSFLQKDVNIQILIIGTVFFTLQIFVHLIVLNLVMKSILSYDLEKKVYLADLENEKNRYVRGLYIENKAHFNNLINDFKNQLSHILYLGSLAKKNQFKDFNLFNQSLCNIVKEAECLNEKVVDLLDKNKGNR